MSDVTVACGEACAGCQDECAACKAEMCADCGGCDHQRKLGQRARAAIASLTLHQIASGVPAEFGFNPLQKRGPDGRWIKMGGAGSAGGKRVSASRAAAPDAPSAPAIPGPRRSVENGIAARVKTTRNDNGTTTYEIAGKQRNWTTAEAEELADALDAVAGGGSVPPPIPGRVVSDGYNRRTVGEVQPFRNNKGGVTLTVGRDKPSGEPGDMDMTVDEARELAELLRETADRQRSDSAARKAERQTAPEHAAAVAEAERRERRREAARKRRQAAKDERLREAMGAEQAEQEAVRPDIGPDPADFGHFRPTPDEEWALQERRLKKRTPQLDPDADFKPGDVVPTSDGKWQEILPGDVRERFGEQYVNVVDDSKGYRHTETITNIRSRVRRYAAERAWRDAGGSKDRLEGRPVATPPPAAPKAKGMPEIGEDGKFAKPTKMYVRMPDGTVETRSSRNPYQWVAEYSWFDKDGNERGWVSWHRTRGLAERGNLTGDQRKNVRVKAVHPVVYSDPGSAAPSPSIPAPRPPQTPQAPRASRAERDEYNNHMLSQAMVTTDLIADGELWSGNPTKQQVRELQNLISDLGDAQQAGNSAEADRLADRIRRLLLDTEINTEDELPTKPRS